jgi:glycosyltransferase involved in cell wall biosynthesis
MAMAFHTSGADMVAGICTLHSDGKILGRHLTSCGDGPLPLEDLLDLDNCWTKGQFFYQPEVMFTRDLWQRAGGHLDESLYFSMDYELWLRFAEQGARLHVIGRAIAIYRVHERQKTFEMEKYRPELTGVRESFERRTARAAGRNGQVTLDRTHLRVVFFNDLGAVAGAGIAHQRLASAMAMAGHEVIPLAIAPNLVECSLSNDSIISAIADRTPDLVILGNIHSARLDPALIGRLSERWPTVQILHDLYSLTGRCPYPGDCTKYLDGCDDTCPTAHEYPTLQPALIQAAWRKKIGAMVGGHPPIIAGVSDWTTQFAQNRFAKTPAGFPADSGTPRIVGIRYGLPLDVFKPFDKSTVRQLLGLPHDRFLILFSAGHLSEIRKGLVHLIEALETSGLPDILAVCIGHFDAPPQVKNFEVRSMGYMADPHSVAMLYSAVDLFVGPSLVETFGQVFIEAAACGTPSVGYATSGGVAEAIADGISGSLAPRQDSAELRAAIQKLYNDPGQRRDMAEWGRLWIENERSYRSAYQRLFAELKKIGLVRQLRLPPKVSFFHDSIKPVPVTYLEPGCQPAPAIAPAATGENANSAQLLSRISGLETERDSLRLAMRNITQTRLWRMVAYFYPKYQRLLGKPFIPRFARRAVHSTAQWLADRPTGQT